MQLIELVYPNAKNGTFSVRKHGTTTPAEAFSDFDGKTPLSASQYVLTSDGAARFFTRDLVDVTVKNSAGTPIDTLTRGSRAESIEVQSPSFLGDNGNGVQVADGVTYLDTVLDKLQASFGDTDFHVKISSTHSRQKLKDALLGLTSVNSPFYNVRDAAYGAVGDDTSDDYPAFKKAYDAAVANGGGIIFIPKGTYYLSTPFVATHKGVSFLGVGPSASILKWKAVSTSPDFEIATGGGVASYLTISGVGFVDTIGNKIIRVLNGDGHIFQNVWIDGPGIDATGDVDIKARVIIMNSRIVVDGGVNFFSGSDYSVIMNSYVEAQTDSIRPITIASIGVRVVANQIVPPDPGEGATAACIRTEIGGDQAVIIGNYLTARSGFPAIERSDDHHIFEAANVLTSDSTGFGLLQPSASTGVSDIVSLSRVGRVTTLTGTSLSPNANYSTNLLDASGNLTVNAPVRNDGSTFTAWDGLTLRIRVRNTTGGAITMTWNAAYHTHSSATANIAAGQTRIVDFEFRGSGAGTGWFQIGSAVDMT